MPEKLSKCPLCGADGMVFHIPKNTKKEMAEHPKWVWQHPGKWVVGCTGGWSCTNDINAYSMIFATKAEAVRFWKRMCKELKEDKR